MFERTFSFWRRLVGGREAPQVAVREYDGDHRRIWVRYPANVETTIQSTNDDRHTRRNVVIQDISQGGARFSTDHVLSEGDLITLELRLNDGMQFVLACAVRVTEEEPQRWTVGCVFSQELSQHELRAYGARREKHDDSDQRQWVRYPCTTQASFQRIDVPDVQYSADVLNISASGVGLIVEKRIETGALLNIDLSNQSGELHQTILACVAHVSRHKNDKWALGCNFIRELSEEDLLTLR